MSTVTFLQEQYYRVRNLILMRLNDLMSEITADFGDTPYSQKQIDNKLSQIARIRFHLDTQGLNFKEGAD